MLQLTMRLCRRASVVVLVVLSLSVTGAAVATLHAQPSNPFDAVLRGLADISRSVQDISSTLKQLVGVVTNPEPGPVTISTGLVRVAPGQTIDCHVANLSSQDIRVRFRAITNTGDWTLAEFIVEPGTGDRLAQTGIGIEGFYRCEFTFTGFANDVRGVLSVIGPALASGEGSAVVTVDAR
jgi:hypothetical protein